MACRAVQTGHNGPMGPNVAAIDTVPHGGGLMPTVADDNSRRIPARPRASGALLDAIRDLHRDATRTRFPLELPGSAQAAESRDRLVDQLSEHLIPRLTELSAPAIVVLAGSTGAGKSTLTNSLVGAEVSQAGVLRPTTRRAVLVHHPDDAQLLSHHPVRSDVEVVTNEAMPRGIALLDAPDLDSVVEENRAWAHRLLESADLWLFVTTATRYGDALPWKVLGEAAQRGTTVAMVLNRVSPASSARIRKDLLQRMRKRGLGDAPLFVIPDVGPNRGPLEPEVVAPISRWMTMLAGPDRARTVIKRTLRGALKALRGWVDQLAEAVQDQADAAQEIATTIDEALKPVRAAAASQIHAGVVADGSVRSRWVELTVRGAALSRPVTRRGTARGSAREVRNRREAVQPLVQDVTSGVRFTMVAASERARDAVTAVLTGDLNERGGAALLRVYGERTSDARQKVATESSAQWVDSATRLVEGLLDPLGEASASGLVDTLRAGAAYRSMGVETVAAIALAGAAGVEAAAELMDDLLGTAGAGLVNRLRDDLISRVELLIDAESSVADEILDDPDLAVDAASRLRLRLAVLKELT